MCASYTKSNYSWPPIDLVILSGILKEEYNIIIMDCIVNNISIQTVKNEIIKTKPDVIISLTSAISDKTDSALFKSIKNNCKIKVLVLGDLPFFQPKKYLKSHSFIDAIILNFTDSSIKEYLKNKLDNIRNIAYRKGKSIIIKKRVTKNFRIPQPQHKKFANIGYNLPMFKGNITSTLTSFGCPHKCKFCFWKDVDYIERDLKNILAELNHIKKAKIKELFFRDLNLVSNENRVLKICEWMKKNKANLSWGCQTRIDYINKKTLSKMKKAGCKFILFGVESGNKKTLASNMKRIGINKTKDTIKNCKKLGITTIGSYILGLPEEDIKLIKKTISQSTSLNWDFVLFHKYTCAYHNKQKNNKKKLINEKELNKLYKKAYIKFYSRPSYILEKFIETTKQGTLLRHISNGLTLFSRLPPKNKIK